MCTIYETNFISCTLFQLSDFKNIGFSIPWIFARLKQIIIVFKTLPGDCFQNSVYQPLLSKLCLPGHWRVRGVEGVCRGPAEEDGSRLSSSRFWLYDQELSRFWSDDQELSRFWSDQLWSEIVLWTVDLTANMRVNSFQGPRASQCSLCFLFINNHEFSIFSIKSINYSASTQSGLFNRQNAPLADFWNNTVADRAGLKTCRKTKCNG